MISEKGEKNYFTVVYMTKKKKKRVFLKFMTLKNFIVIKQIREAASFIRMREKKFRLTFMSRVISNLSIFFF